MSDPCDFEKLYAQYAADLLAFFKARIRSHHDADELAQQTWLKVQRALAEQFDGRNFRAWLYKIANNVLIDHLRVNGRETAQSLGNYDPADDRLTMEERLEQTERLKMLSECMKKLNQHQAAVVRLRAEGKDYKEIADQLGVPDSTAMTRFHRAKNNLNECMQGKRT